ncbi:CRISPR-associated helicase Cas3' [candidate division KSB1 bacterium]|nr:CRISPR-associated helicase Cas3' [candidate division KSB1 bacterium]
MKDILAKPNETLVRHTEACLSVWNDLKEKYKPYIPEKDFWDKSYLSVLFHDIGKIIDSFQEMMIAKKEGKYFDYNLNFRHELFSGVFLLGIIKDDILPVAAVLTHHKKLNPEIFSRDKNRNVNYNVDDIVNFVDYFEFKRILNLDNFPQWQKGNQYYNAFFSVVFEKFSMLTMEDRKKYFLYKGILNTCDWLGSGHLKLQHDLVVNEIELKKKIEEKLKKKIEFDPFQLYCMNVKNDCLVIAPTGSGKTEAALLWAGKKMGKIVYLLPTKVTSNAIYERMIQCFGEQNVGLVHSSALNYHHDNNENYDSKEYLIDKAFFKPLTVATIDQLLTTGFNIGYWSVKSLNCVGAKIIIDEIHAYDFYTIGLTIATIKYLKDFDALFFLMSATIPKFLKELILNEIPDIQLIENRSLLQNARNQFFIKNYTVDNLENEIIQPIKKNRKVLVVVNTVDEAIRLYEKFEEYDPICYHSRFMVKDRTKKENEIANASKSDNGCLVITTQVVEVSLDIDFDILFTENAPADAIIQRAGRVNRKGIKTESKVIIFKHQQVTEEKIYDKAILDNTMKEFKKYDGDYISEMDFQKIVNKVYKDIQIVNNVDFIEGLQKYNEIQNHYNFIQDVMPSDGDIFTRLIKYIKIPVIPDEFMGDIVEFTPREKSQFQIDLPYWVKNKFKIYSNKDGFTYGEIDYDDRRGAKLFNKNGLPPEQSSAIF